MPNLFLSSFSFYSCRGCLNRFRSLKLAAKLQQTDVTVTLTFSDVNRRLSDLSEMPLCLTYIPPQCLADNVFFLLP